MTKIPGLDLHSPEEAAPNKTTGVIYGPAGSGKTTFAATWPGVYVHAPSLSANELKSLQGMGMKDNVMIFQTIKEMERQAKAFSRAVVAGNLPDCHTYVFDNLTSAQLMAEYELLRETGKDKLNWEEWNRFAKYWKDMITYMHALPINVLWITHSETKPTIPPNGGEPYDEGFPTLSGKSRKFIPGYADLFLYCSSVDRGPGIPLEFRVHLKQKDVWPARIRGNVKVIDKLPPYIGGLAPDNRRIDPTYDVLAKLLGWETKAEIEGGKKPKQKTETKVRRKFKIPKRKRA